MKEYKELRRNYKIIKKFAIQYRKELTVFQGVFGEFCGQITCSDYVKFTNKLSDDEFVGALLCSLFKPYDVEIYKQILDGKKDFNVFLDDYLTNDARKIYNKNMSK